MATQLEQIQILVSGQVQGVGFRYAASDAARAMELKGWVRNLIDGKVEILAEGDSDSITQFIKWCHAGPAMAAVTNVEVQERKPIPKKSHLLFEILT